MHEFIISGACTYMEFLAKMKGDMNHMMYM